MKKKGKFRNGAALIVEIDDKFQVTKSFSNTRANLKTIEKMSEDTN